MIGRWAITLPTNLQLASGIPGLQRQRGGLFEQLADAREEASGVGAVEDAVVAGQGDGHRAAGR